MGAPVWGLDVEDVMVPDTEAEGSLAPTSVSNSPPISSPAPIFIPVLL